MDDRFLPGNRALRTGIAKESRRRKRIRKPGSQEKLNSVYPFPKLELGNALAVAGRVEAGWSNTVASSGWGRGHRPRLQHQSPSFPELLLGNALVFEASLPIFARGNRIAGPTGMERPHSNRRSNQSLNSQLSTLNSQLSTLNCSRSAGLTRSRLPLSRGSHPELRQIDSPVPASCSTSLPGEPAGGVECGPDYWDATTR